MTLDSQIERLVLLGYPEMLGLSNAAFTQDLLPLKAHVPADAITPLDIDAGKIPAVLVINTPLAPVSRTLPLASRKGLHAIERLYPRTSQDFRPLASVQLPGGCAYLLMDVDRGNQTLNLVPLAAEQLLSAAHRLPLTVEEGVAVLTLFPEFLQPNRCFMMLASRCGDKRVPALWLSDKRPKLGWCWEGNPHTWLGFASCGARSAGVALQQSEKKQAIA